MLFCALTMHRNYLSGFTMIQVYRADRSHHTHLGVTKPYCQLCGSQYIRFNARQKESHYHIFFAQHVSNKLQLPDIYCKSQPRVACHFFCITQTHTHTHIHLVIKYSLQCPTCPSDFINKLHYFGQCDATWCIRYLRYYWRP